MRCSLASVLLLLAASSFAWADETAPAPESQKVAIATSVAPREVRTYKVAVEISGSMPKKDSAEPLKVDASYKFRLQHKYGVWDKDGLMTLSVGMLDGEAKTSEGPVALDSGFFPKLSLLIDRDWQVKTVFGTNGTEYQRSKPGLNWVNLILLFYLHGANTPHAIGESWTAKAGLPVYQETYTFINTIKGIESNGAKSAAVVQEMTWTPRSEIESKCKAGIQSTFALDNGKLIRSRADCDVEFSQAGDSSQQQEVRPLRANIKIDITAVD